jgi:hypothetical protein
MPLKAYKLYGSFEGWITAHKHSSCTISSELDDSLAMGGDNPIETLETYIYRLEEVRTEIATEISEAHDWIDYFKRRKKR